MTGNKARPLKRYVAVYEYNATQRDELTLRKDDVLMVSEVYPDSWMKGVRLRDMAIGVFPGNFVKSLPVTSTGEIKESKRCHVCKEILTSEMSYGRVLWQLEQDFAEPLKSSSIITPEEHSKIFAHTQALVKLNEDLVGQLRMRMQTWDDERTLMGDIFLKRAPLLKLLEGYALQFPQARQAMEKLRKTNRAFASHCAKAESSSGQLLQSMLMNPIQRAPRYELLLKELLKQSPAGHPDYGNIDAALGQVNKINVTMNENLRRMENEQRIIQISKSFPNDDPKILQASRQFNLARHSRKSKDKEEKFLEKRKRLSSFGANLSPGSSSPTPGHRSPQTQRPNRPRQHSDTVSPEQTDSRKQLALTPQKSASNSGNQSPSFRFSLCLNADTDPFGLQADKNDTNRSSATLPPRSSPTSAVRAHGRMSVSSLGGDGTPGRGMLQSRLSLPPGGMTSSQSSVSMQSMQSSLPLSPSTASGFSAIGSDSLFDTSTQRFFIREGSVYLTSNSGVERYLFLFTDVMLIASTDRKSRKVFKLKERAALSQCWVLNGKNFNCSFPNITVVFGTPSQLHNWVFLKEDEKNMWLADLERFVTEQKTHYLCGVIDETELPDKLFCYLTFKTRSQMKAVLQMELALPANEDIMVIGYEGTNGKWQPALSTSDPDDTGIEWWFGWHADQVGWFPVGCILENDQLAFLNTQASQCKPVPITTVQKMKALWTAETLKAMPALGMMRIARVYDKSGSFKTIRVQDDASVDSLISGYYHNGLVYRGRTFDLYEMSTDESYVRLIAPEESPAAVVDQWGRCYRDSMKLYIKERDDQPRSRLFTNSTDCH